MAYNKGAETHQSLFSDPIRPRAAADALRLGCATAAAEGGVSAVQPVSPPLAPAEKKHAAPLVEGLLGLLVMAGLLWINRGVGFLLLLFLLPVLGEWLRLKGSGLSGMGVALAVVPMGLLLMPAGQGVAFALYGLLAAWLSSPWPPARRLSVRALLWGAMTTGMLLFLIGQGYAAYRAVDPGYTGGLSDYMADWITASMAQSPQGNALLVSAYQAGYARYGEAGAALPAFRVGGVIVLSAEVREQLLLSLRHTMRETMRQSVPVTLLFSGGLTAMVTAIVAGGAMRRRQLPCDVPPFAQWHLPRGWGIRIGVLSAGYVLQGAATPLLTYQAALLVGVFRFVYAVQGISTVHFLIARMGVRRLGTALVTILGLWLVPDVFLLIGLFDQISPMRQLRKKQQEG